MNAETLLMQQIRLALGAHEDLALWRNNVGKATLEGGHVVAYGLAVGSSDLIGCLGGRFLALEVKTSTGRVTPEQARYLTLVRSKGGFACVVRSVEDAQAAVERCRKGANE